MQIKDQRVTNIKQKYGPKFEPITFTVEEAPGTARYTGGCRPRLSSEGWRSKESMRSAAR
jgi:hypothetical protein